MVRRSERALCELRGSFEVTLAVVLMMMMLLLRFMMMSQSFSLGNLATLEGAAEGETSPRLPLTSCRGPCQRREWW